MARHVFRGKLQNCNGEEIGRFGLQELMDMEAAGTVRRISRLKADQAVYRLLHPRRPDSGADGESAISVSDMQANAGVLGRRRWPSRKRKDEGNFVHHAMTKVEIWPHVGEARWRARAR